MNTEREKALKNVQMHEFALIDAALYLDTHPNDREALDYYFKMVPLFTQAKKEFAEKYGPITMSQISDRTNWEWVKGPWPWEGMDN